MAREGRDSSVEVSRREGGSRQLLSFLASPAHMERMSGRREDDGVRVAARLPRSDTVVPMQLGFGVCFWVCLASQ